MQINDGLLTFGALSAAAYWTYLHLAVRSWKSRADAVEDIKRYRAKVESGLAQQLSDVSNARDALGVAQREHQRERSEFALVLDSARRRYPWAAAIHADLLATRADDLAQALERKKHPAARAAEEVREFKRDVRDRIQRLKYAEYKALVYEHVFPFLRDFIEDAPTDELAVGSEAERSDDPVRQYLSPDEWAKLGSADRAQRALDRYLARRKSNWEIGREYERYVGYEYERRGWDVEFHGAIRGLEDLGRDLIARSDGRTLVIQCKYWSTHREVHENAIFQLFGSLVDYLFERNLISPQDDVFSALDRHQVRGIFFTSTTLSERALTACRSLRIEAKVSTGMDADYPRIKCNQGKAEKLYHLPFDQMYDRVKIEPSKGEFYAKTTREAEAMGFRRVYRWRPSADASSN